MRAHRCFVFHTPLSFLLKVRTPRAAIRSHPRGWALFFAGPLAERAGKQSRPLTPAKRAGVRDDSFGGPASQGGAEAAPFRIGRRLDRLLRYERRRAPGLGAR